jgi:hypothetical protein
VVAPTQPTSSCMISHHSSTYFPMAEKKEENREKDLKKEEGVVSFSLLFHGGVKLIYIRGYARAPAKSHESGVYDRGGVSYLSCA